MKNEILYYDTYASPLGLLHIYMNGQGELVCLDTSDALSSNHGYKVEKGSQDFVKAQLDGYFNRQLTGFRVQTRPVGTAFQLAVWAELTAIPYGITTTYREIAARIGKPAAVRAVGNAVGANPILVIIPCHRVITSSGTIGGYRCGVDKKRLLLKIEGVSV